MKAYLSLPELRGIACNISRWGWGVIRSMEKIPNFWETNKTNDRRSKEKKVEEMNRKESRPYTPGGKNAWDKLKLHNLLLKQGYMYSLHFFVSLTK